FSLSLLLHPDSGYAQGQMAVGAPPVGQPLVNEGEFAVSLASALGITTTNDDVEAESRLGDIGVAPRNGWIADYPVTPDILAELQNAVGDAASSGRLSMGADEARNKFFEVAVSFGLKVKAYTAGAPYEPTPASCQNYPNPIVVNNTFSSEGAPIVTYYCPPPDYYEMYTWVPCPFWWADLWFPGFFILHDFHRVTRIHHRVVVISNHFNDVRTHRAFRIDPAERFRGKTFAGIGVTRPKNFIPTGVTRGERTIFNPPRANRAPALPTSIAPPREIAPTRIAPPVERPAPPAGIRESPGRELRR
ncbi:MAG TPA: hypothetical protein VI389_06820, partial [Geobacteraceae bacterium]